jgi:hypothetical protein
MGGGGGLEIGAGGAGGAATGVGTVDEIIGVEV